MARFRGFLVLVAAVAAFTDASAQAGEGDLVTYEASREAALLHDPWFVPVDHAIVGIVDQVNLG